MWTYQQSESGHEVELGRVLGTKYDDGCRCLQTDYCREVNLFKIFNPYSLAVVLVVHYLVGGWSSDQFGIRSDLCCSFNPVAEPAPSWGELLLSSAI
jgi:hypothetical protein